MVSRFALLGLALAVGLAWLGLEWFREPPNPSTPPPQETREPTPLNLPSAYLGDMDAFVEITERPLFIEGRQPPSISENQEAQEVIATQNQAPNVQQDLGNLRLTAIIVDSGKRSALLESAGGETDRIVVGGRINNWTVESIRDDAVVLKAGATTKRLEIYRFEPAPVRPEPRRQPRLVRNPNRRDAARNRPEKVEQPERGRDEYDPNNPEAD